MSALSLVEVAIAERESECRVVRPFTLGYQRCIQISGHGAVHRSQDGSEWSSLTCDPKPGDLIEATIASSHPCTVRVRIDRSPWPINSHSHTITDGDQIVLAVLSASIRIVEAAA